MHWFRSFPAFFTQILATAVACLPLLWCAQALGAHSDDELFEEAVPIVLSASRLIQPVSSSPASITIIDAEMIELSGARTIVDLLNLVPGFQVGRLVNGDPIATYHGLSERYNPRLQLIIDGRPTYVPLYGGIPWSELPVALTDVERIEVTRAPNAATFGPNSFSAVVSITTRSPASGSGWFVNTEAGGNKFRTGTLSYYGDSKDSNYRVTLQAERDEGFRNIPDKERTSLASVRTNWQVNATDRIGIDIGATFGGHVELDTVVEENDLVGYTDTTNAYTQFVWERSHATDDSLKVQYYYNYFDIQDRQLRTFDFEQVTGNPQAAGLNIDVDINRDSRSIRHELEVQRTTRLSNRHRLVYGGAVRQDSVEGTFIFNDTDKRFVSTQRVFAHSEFTPRDRWLINSGLLVENNSLTNVSASPRVSVSYEAALNKQIRLGYSRGIRTPLLLEEDGVVEFEYLVSNGLVLTDQFIIDENRLKPETADVVDLGFYASNVRPGLNVDAKLSYHRLRDGIGTRLMTGVETDTFDQDVRTYQNRFDYHYKTFDAQIDYRVRSRYRFRLAYAYAFGEDPELGRRKLIPRHTLTLFGSVRWNPVLSTTAEYYYTSNWIWDDVRDESRQNRLDLRVARNLQLPRLNVSLALQAELDLGNSVDYLERNQVGDLYFARMTLQLP